MHLNLGSALCALGYITDAVRNYRIAAAASEPEVRAMSLRNLACIAPGDPALDDAAILEIRRAWAAQEAVKISSPGTRQAAPGERLRIAYFGTFFADRNWMKMYMGVLNAHDRDRFEVNLIVDGALPSAASGYRDHENDRIWQVAGISNAELASHIAVAKIDVLIDLNGYSHTARLPLLLHRPAPLQIAWQGMYGTTGFPGVDFLISDEAALPSGEERHYTERIHRVRHTYLPFHVFYETPAVVPPPCLQNGHITFGSLASAYKLTPYTLAAWSQILHAVPTARLLVRNAALDHESNRADLLARFAERQIPAQRLTLLGPAEHLEFLRTYDQIDIALDAFPYNGGTTTAEALWQATLFTINGDRGPAEPAAPFSPPPAFTSGSRPTRRAWGAWLSLWRAPNWHRRALRSGQDRREPRVRCSRSVPRAGAAVLVGNSPNALVAMSIFQAAIVLHRFDKCTRFTRSKDPAGIRIATHLESSQPTGTKNEASDGGGMACIKTRAAAASLSGVILCLCGPLFSLPSSADQFSFSAEAAKEQEKADADAAARAQSIQALVSVPCRSGSRIKK